MQILVLCWLSLTVFWVHPSTGPLIMNQLDPVTAAEPLGFQNAANPNGVLLLHFPAVSSRVVVAWSLCAGEFGWSLTGSVVVTGPVVPVWTEFMLTQPAASGVYRLLTDSRCVVLTLLTAPNGATVLLSHELHCSQVSHPNVGCVLLHVFTVKVLNNCKKISQRFMKLIFDLVCRLFAVMKVVFFSLIDSASSVVS